jgi:hypothetical protein
LDYAILGGFGAVNEMKRLGMGDSVVIEVFDLGMTADRAYQVGLSNGVFDEELEALRRGYERARLMAKDAPYSRALFKHQLARDIDDEALAKEAGAIFNPKKNPFISTGLLALLDRGARAPKMNYACRDAELPGWHYPNVFCSGRNPSWLGVFAATAATRIRETALGSTPLTGRCGSVLESLTWLKPGVTNTVLAMPVHGRTPRVTEHCALADAEASPTRAGPCFLSEGALTKDRGGVGRAIGRGCTIPRRRARTWSERANDHTNNVAHLHHVSDRADRLPNAGGCGARATASGGEHASSAGGRF